MAISNYLIGNAKEENEPDRDLSDDQLVNRTIQRVNDWFSYFAQNIENARDDLYFAVISQWDPVLYAQREEDGKACLEVNYIYAIIASIVGQYRKQTPEFKIFTITDESNPKAETNQPLIDLYDGRLRQILFDNKSEIVFQQAGESALLRGFGALILSLEYESDMSFHQVPKLRSASDPFSVFWDPSAKEPSKEDSRYCGEIITYTVQQYNDTFRPKGKEEEVELPGSFPVTSLNKATDNFWRSEDWVRVANVYVKESYPKKIALLSDGRSMEYKKAEEEVAEHAALMKSVRRKENQLRKTMASLGHNTNDKSFLDTHTPLEIIDSRDTIDYKIMNYLMSDDEILESSEWPSKIMPIIFVDGHSQMVDGEQVTKSYHRTAKDAQRIANYTVSESVENLMNSHKEQWIGTPENFKGYLNEWRNPSLAKGVLLANKDQGEMPQQVSPPQISPNLMSLFEQSTQSIKNTLGYFEANAGEKSNEQSGVAVNNRAKQGSMANFVYFDNWGRSIEQSCKCIMSLIPATHDTTRSVTIRKKNGEQSIVDINTPKQGEFEGDEQFENDMTKGNYGIQVTVGSNYEIQLQENLASIQELISTLAPTNPAVVGVLADLVAANINLENKTQIVDRIRKTILGQSPSEILREEMELPPEPKKPDPQEMMMQMEMKLKEGDLQAKNRDLDIKQQQVQNDQMELQLKQQEIQLEHEKNIIAAQKNDVERYKSDKSLEEIHETMKQEQRNNETDIETESMKLVGNLHKGTTAAHSASAGIHIAEIESRNRDYSPIKKSVKSKTKK